MSSTTFTFDVDDAQFTLFDQLRMHERLAAVPHFRDYDKDVYAATISEAYRIAREVIAPLNKNGDRQGCRFEGDGVVRTPDGYPAAWNVYRAGGWVGPRAPVELGGAGMPAPMGAVLNEMFSGACFAFEMYAGLTSAAARVIAVHAPEKFRREVATKLFAGDWAGTMCLTEAGAGSSVGDNRTKARPADEPGMWLLEGEKIFITGGDQDLTKNICHMVLARTPGSPNGTKGLSLFLVPKFMFDESTLALGERNGAKVLGIEHKMGINGSATCTLGLGVDGPCRAWMVGAEREGITLMFAMMNEARIGVGLQGVAAGSSAYQYALHYARERVQGPRLEHVRDPDAERVAIIEHPDVRRMLMTQKVLVETMRSMGYRLALDFELSEAGLDADALGRVDLLVPVFKSICTDLGFQVAVLGVQIHGGYGYTGEFPIEQVVRDAKIQSIYEGTNGIQALDLLGRKMRSGGGKLFMSFHARARAELAAGKSEGFAAQAESLDKAVQGLGAAAMHLAKVGQGKPAAAMLHAVPFLDAFGRVVLGLEALDQARVAKRMLDAGEGAAALLRGKLANLDFYVAHLLPHAVALTKTVQSGDASCLDDACFARG